MLKISKIVLRGLEIDDAEISFSSGANILTGESDTGKSYLVHCLDFIFGAKTMKKRFEKVNRYSTLFVEFSNSLEEKLTLKRELSGGNLLAYYSSIENITGAGRKVLPKRSPKSKVDDVSAILFPFAGLPEAQLRKNVHGELQRLTVRTLLPLFLVDEKSIISDDSPVTGESGFDITARKRMLSFMLTGTDDKGIAANENKEMAKARLAAQLSLIDRLEGPLETRLADHDLNEINESRIRVESSITQLSNLLRDTSGEREALQERRRLSLKSLQHAESQIIAIEELQKRYDLLDDRYHSDLDRLDFLAEGSHYLRSLQLVNCPCCGRPLSSAHSNESDQSTLIENSSTYEEAATAEAAKILALIKDLKATSDSLANRRKQEELNLKNSARDLENIDARLRKSLEPAMWNHTDELRTLVERRVHLESIQQEQAQLDSLRAMRAMLETASRNDSSPTNWSGIPTDCLSKMCVEIASLLVDWKWADKCEVYFDQSEFDIVVDGQARQSHGKGVRAILYSAFVLGLLNFCKKNNRPHLGVVVLDSPLTSYKKAATLLENDIPIAEGIESGFWRSLESFGPEVQVIVIENKEPPASVARNVHYQRFAGVEAQTGQRKGFVPA